MSNKTAKELRILSLDVEGHASELCVKAADRIKELEDALESITAACEHATCRSIIGPEIMREARAALTTEK